MSEIDYNKLAEAIQKLQQTAGQAANTVATTTETVTTVTSKSKLGLGWFTQSKRNAVIGAGIIFLVGYTVMEIGGWAWLAPRIAPYLYSQPATEAQGFLGQVLAGLQSDFAGFARNLNTNWYEALKSLAYFVWPLVVTTVSYLFAMNRIARGAVAVGSKVKGTVENQLESKEVKQLKGTVETLNQTLEEQTRNKQAVEEKLAEEQAQIKQLQAQLKTMTESRDRNKANYDEMWQHQGIRVVAEQMGLERYREE